MPGISLLKATLPWRSTDVIMISARNIGTTTAEWPRRVLWIRSYARQASTKRRESNGSDVQWCRAHPKMPPDWVFAELLIEQLSLPHFYFTNSGLCSRMSSVFVLCNLLQKWVCYACPKFWKFLPECTVTLMTLVWQGTNNRDSGIFLDANMIRKSRMGHFYASVEQCHQDKVFFSTRYTRGSWFSLGCHLNGVLFVLDILLSSQRANCFCMDT